MVSQKAIARTSRRYTWTAFVAGAVGALVASLVYLSLNDAELQGALGDAPAPVDSGPVRRGVVDVEPPPQREVLVPTASDTPARASGAVTSAASAPVSAQALPSSTARAPVRPKALPRQSDGEPPPERASDPPPTPSPSGSSRVWVKPPPRKPWVD